MYKRRKKKINQRKKKKRKKKNKCRKNVVGIVEDIYSMGVK